MTTITVRLTHEQKEAIKGFSKLKNTSVSDVVLSAIMEKIDDEEDYELALEAAKSPISSSSISDLAKELNIDYDEL
ncbi:MAG: hypothetical protein GX328_07360 [Clostridiaceae bacterium]|nr:hypothetical protein [Clostridiaceae bacterium]